MRKIPYMRRFGVWGDDLLGYGKPDYSRKWWLDLETVDGIVQVPRTIERQGRGIDRVTGLKNDVPTG